MKSINEGPFQWRTVSDVITGGLRGQSTRSSMWLESLTTLSAEEKEGIKRHSCNQYPTSGVYQDIYPLTPSITILDAKDIGKMMQLNSKFVNNMLPEWSRFITEVKLNRVTTSLARPSLNLQITSSLKQTSTESFVNARNKLLIKTGKLWFKISVKIQCRLINKEEHFKETMREEMVLAGMLGAPNRGGMIKSWSKSKTEEVKLLKKDFKQKEDKFLEEFFDLKKIKDKIEDRLYKQGSKRFTLKQAGQIPKKQYKEKYDPPAKKENKKEVEVRLRTNRPTRFSNSKSKLSDNSLSKTQRVWKATGKLFTDIGYQWRPTGKKLTLGKLDCGSQWRPTGKKFALGEMLTKRTPTKIGEPIFQTLQTRLFSNAGRTGHALVSGLGLLQTYDGESFKAHEFCGKVHRKANMLCRDLNGTTISLKEVVAPICIRISIDEMMNVFSDILLSKLQVQTMLLASTNIHHPTDNGHIIRQPSSVSHYEGVGIFHQKSVPRTPQQNGVVERRNRTLVEACSYNDDILESSHVSMGRTVAMPFDEPVPSATEINAQVVPPSTSLSTTIAQDAPSTSASSSTSNSHLPVQHQEIPEDTPIIHDVLHPSHNLVTGDPGSAQSSSGNVNSAKPNQVNYPPDHLRRWNKDHPLDNIVGNLSRPVSTRK
ncbi:retrovirus-related pol polyprotein from transposon TNT 1-94 [Tanacetum coccineum]